MTSSKYQATFLVATALMLIGLGLASAAQNQENSEHDRDLVDITTLPSARAQFQLPKLFDFSKFTSLFGKHYHSVMESLVRKKIYLARAFSAFISVVSYKHEKSTSYLSINSRSDRTPEELDRLKISADKMRIIGLEEEQQLDKRAETTEKPASKATEPLPVADLDDIERELDGLSEHKGDSEAEAILEELKASRRTRRNAEKRHQLSADQLLHSPDAVDSAEREEKPMDESAMNSFMKARGSPYVKSVMGWFGGRDKSQGQWDTEEPQDLETSGSDVVYMDHRQFGCFFEPRQQGDCGSCYAFAAVALFEYLFCRYTRKRIAFSEQYLVDCGTRYEEPITGCEGASISQAVGFVEEMGLHLLDHYPYREEEGTCPYDEDTPTQMMGHVRAQNGGFERIIRPQIDERLNQVPLMVTMLLNDQFLFYGGGVNKIRECDLNHAHVMLLVGHGLEDGIEYYLLRNSYSVDWGEGGYYKISKKSFRKCLANKVAVQSLATFSRKAAKLIVQ